MACKSFEHPYRNTEPSSLGRLPREQDILMEDRKTGLCSDINSIQMMANMLRCDADLVLDACAVALSTGKACLMLHTHGWFVGNVTLMRSASELRCHR